MVGGRFNELALFAGAGGGILGGKLLGWRTVCAVECDPYAASILAARQNDGTLAPFPIWDDVCSFDGRPWRGAVDVISGGFPCQDISAAGKGAGIEGERSGLWVEMARIIREVRPRFVFVENSPMLTSRGLGVVLGDLAAMGFDAQWGVLGAHHAGAPHKRDRIWIVAADRERMADADQRGRIDGFDHHEGSVLGAGGDGEARHEEGRRGIRGGPSGDGAGPPDVRNPDSNGQPARAIDAEASGVPGDVADADGTQREGVQRASGANKEHADAGRPGWWQAEPAVGRVADGVAHRVDRLRAIGNGQVPAVAALAWTELLRRLKEDTR